MSGIIALVGGDEFRPGCEETDLPILREASTTPARVLIIPTAAALENPSLAASHGVRYFSRLGADATDLPILNRTDADDEVLTQAISDATVIYFTGGSPTHLLATLQGSLLLTRLQEALAGGAVLAGSSAGAMVMGSMIRVPPSSGAWSHGLGLAGNLAVLPHHERSDPAAVAKSLAQAELPEGLLVLGIDGKTGCLGRPGSWRVVGPGNVTLYQEGHWAVFRAGEELPERL